MFQETIKKIAVQTAVLLFFVMSLVGWMYGLPITTCSTRAAVGAMAVYGLVRIAGQLIVWLLVKVIIRDWITQHNRLTQG